ncbi:MAG TPA: T9SS type A sorting domain-containing protein [Bacteroidia bacterium]|jgi:hypothetical protein|nr:T9SS type A sorting domain-containing protein [Bacteroidia bacterium]
MKKLLFFSILFVTIRTSAQVPIVVYCLGLEGVNFDDSSANCAFIDTVNYPGNVWQIGHSTKQFFNNPYSPPHSIMTDTLNHYPANNFSVFQLTLVKPPYLTDRTVQVTGWNIINSDSAHDGGMIQTSHDQGQTWTNLIDDTSAYFFGPNTGYSINDTVAALSGPGFSGESPNPYDQFGFFAAFPVGAQPADDDTLMLRFVFASDSIPDTLSGWLIDDIYIGLICMNVPQLTAFDQLNIFPNPSAGIFSIENKSREPIGHITVHDVNGRVVYSGTLTGDAFALSFLPDGYYEAIFEGKDNRIVKRLTISH